MGPADTSRARDLGAGDQGEAPSPAACAENARPSARMAQEAERAALYNALVLIITADAIVLPEHAPPTIT